jgi:type IV pilus assembly protein PilW
MNPARSIANRGQQGLTLVELLISITLSLLVLAAILQMFVGTKQSYNLQEGLARMQENGRYAIDLLARDIGMAAFPRSLGGAAFVAATTTDSTTDEITVSYQSTTSCLNNATTGAAVNHFYISNDTLFCDDGIALLPEGLVEGVENMQILYGVDSTGDGMANSYVNATAVAAGVVAAGTADWSRVVSVRVALLVDTGQTVSPDNDTGGYVLLDAAPITPASNLTFRRRVFTTTVPIRNQMP